jgi:hypothetical protein
MVHCTMPSPELLHCTKAMAVGLRLVRCAATTVSEVTGSQDKNRAVRSALRSGVAELRRARCGKSILYRAVR